MEENRTYQPVNGAATAEVVSFKEWIITLLIMMIPLVNLVMPFVWAFSGGTNPSKANFFKASIIIGVVSILLWVLFVGSMVGSIMSSTSFN